MNLNRRGFVAAFTAALATDLLLRSRALASAPRALDSWAQDIADLNRDLSRGIIGLDAWQDGIAASDSGIDLAGLRRYLDFDRLTSALDFPTRLAETVDPKFPSTVNIAGIERKWFLRFFGMRKGGTIIPHVHNNMVSSHLVMQGSFHARTFDRVDDDVVGRSVRLKPTRDGRLAPGELITMSDDRDNGHWLVAQEDRSFTFDIGMVDIDKSRQFALKANDYNMIFVDPTTNPGNNGLIEAPVISFEECRSKFAG